MTDSYAPHDPLADALPSDGNTLPAAHGRDISLSDILTSLALSPQSHLSVRDMTDALGERSFGASLAVFALPNLMPLPPGTTIVLGIPLLFVTWQMMVSARSHLWFPERFANYRVDKATFSAFAGRAIPMLRFAERWVRPRYSFLHGRMAERLLGAFALLLATVVFLPIPLGNWMPALALAIIGLTLTARDGLGIIAGVCVGIASMFVVAGTIFATVAALAYFL